MNALPISVFIIAKNEADRIAATINSVKNLVSEVIVIDSGSSDETIAVAQANGAKVQYNKWAGYGLQKRFGEDLCKNNWLLNLDADEEISPELALEIQELFAGDYQKNAGYTIDVYHLLSGERKIPARTQMNRVLRLYDKRFARFSDSPVHDSVIVREGNVSSLKAAVFHRSYRNLTHAIDKINSYSTMQAQDLLKRNVLIPTWRLYVEFPASFIKAYFFRAYIFRGTRGFSYAMAYAFSRFLRFAKYHELHKLKDEKYDAL
jgi:glycosyltransferase involved in cell wall biosynthesis